MNSIDYKIVIESVEKMLGDRIWDNVGEEYVIILSIEFSSYLKYILKVRDKNGYEYTRNIEDLALKEPIKYQLPDAEGNLHEVKIG
jgi:hypothetical protein